MNAEVKILGVGHCCQDYICIVENFPKENSSTHILEIDDTQGGGAVATALVAASRLGAECFMMGYLGDDLIGDKIIKGFKKENINIDYIKRIHGGRSSTSYVMVNKENGSRTKFPFRDSLPDIEFNATLEDAIAKADVVHLDGTQYNNAYNAAKIAKKHGVTVSLDACALQENNEKNIRLLSLVDIFISNNKYPYKITGQNHLEQALRNIKKIGPKVIVTTYGANGVYYLENETLKHIPAYKVNTVDTTGAGDAFHGAFIYGLFRGFDLKQTIQFASATAAIKCTGIGGRNALPVFDRVINFLDVNV